MKTRTYTARNGATQYKPSFSALESMRHADDGFCLACGEVNHGVEPDARKYKCQCCGAPKVYGAEELMIMNLFFKG